MKILILGINGFIGSNLIKAILSKSDWEVYGIDLATDKISDVLNHPRLTFLQGDITKQKTWIAEHLQKADVILPLVAIATPASYVQNPLKVFELDFEANLEIIRLCVEHKKRIIFPSTSEVYGMCPDLEFDEEKSVLVTGPIHKERWIYSTSKQLLDRIIYAYGKHHQLQYSLFRPFNWYGPNLDNIYNPKQGGSRVLTQFIGNILRGETIYLVDGGEQKRCFMYIDDGVDALLRLIENKDNRAAEGIFNIGNAQENISIRTLAEMLVQYIKSYPQHAENASQAKIENVSADQYYGTGYQDVTLRVPSIKKAKEILGWEPKVNLEDGLRKTLDFYFLNETSS